QLAALGVGVSGNDVAQVGDPGLGQVATPVHACVMKAFCIGAANKIAHVGDSAVCNHVSWLDGVYGAGGAGYASEAVENVGVSGNAIAIFESFKLACLDFIQVVIAAQQQQRYGGWCRVVGVFGGQDDGLDCVG